MVDRPLTEKEQKFLDVLFEEAEGDYVKAKKLAGFSPNTATKQITDKLSDEIYELTKQYINKLGVKAVWSMKSVMDNPTQLGNRDLMVASKDILDRANLKSSDKVEIKAESPLFILPEKSQSE